MANLLDLAHELFLRIACYLSNEDLEALTRTCRALHRVLGAEVRIHNDLLLRSGLDTRRRLYEMARHPHRFQRIQDLTIRMNADRGESDWDWVPWKPSSAELVDLLQDWKRLQDHASWLSLVWPRYPRLEWNVEFMLYILNCHDLQSLTLRALDYERVEDDTREPWRCDISSCASVFLSSSLWQTGVFRRLSCLTLDAMEVSDDDVNLPFEGMQITKLCLFNCAIDSRSWVNFFQHFPLLRYLDMKWTTRCRDSEEEYFRDDYEDYQGVEPGEDSSTLKELYEGLYQCRNTIERIAISIGANQSSTYFDENVLGHFQDFVKLECCQVLIGSGSLGGSSKKYVWRALHDMPGYIEQSAHQLWTCLFGGVVEEKFLFKRVYRASSTEEEVNWWNESDSE